MDEKLYEAALDGNVDSLVELLDQDPSILQDRDAALISSSRRFVEDTTPLHVAASLGHQSFFDQILGLKPNFAFVVNRQGSLPLHIACCKGHEAMVSKLLSVNPDGCFARDGEGQTPFQIAAAKGRVKVLVDLVRAKPSGARILTDRGETILHLCVKHNRLKALKQLLNEGGDVVREMVNFKDEDDNTVLHLSVAQKNVQMVKLLVRRNYQMDVKATNLDGLTAMDMLSYDPSTGILEKSIEKVLRKAGVKRSAIAKKQRALVSRQKKRQKHEDWLMNTKGTLMIVAILIATATYQSGLSPPGGVVQMDAGNNTSSATPPILLAPDQMLSTADPGVAVMAITNELAYKFFIIVNTAVFFSSLSIILMLVSGFPLQRKLFVWVLMVVTWIAIISMALTYNLALVYMTAHSIPYSSIVSIVGLLLMFVFLLLGHFIRFLVRVTRRLLTKLRSILGRRRRPTAAAQDHQKIIAV